MPRRQQRSAPGRDRRAQARDSQRPGAGQGPEEVLVYGLHAVEMLLQVRAGRVLEVLLQAERHDRRLDRIRGLVREHGVAFDHRPRSELDLACPDANHQGVVARCRPSAALPETELDAVLEQAGPAPLLLVLDQVQDPHNLGACLRSADAAGAAACIAPRDRSAGLTPVVRKVASGAAETVPLVSVTNLARTLRRLRDAGVRIVGAAGEAGRSLYEADLTGPVALVMGAEGKGLRRLTRETCDELVRIPMQGGVDSLNVSVATGICLFEAVRQRAYRSNSVQ